MEKVKKYDEERELPSPWEWVIILSFSASIVLFGLLVYRIIQDGPQSGGTELRTGTVQPADTKNQEV